MRKLSRFKTLLLLLLVVLLAAIFRLTGLNWDQGQHLHPDERMITMVTMKIRLPQTSEEWQNVFTPQSTLNPEFFPYGSFPIYLLKISGFLTGWINLFWQSYDGINLVGRLLSAIFDIGTIVLLYLLGKKLFNSTVGLLAAFFYTLSVLPIQLAHFYAVDTQLTFFIILTLYRIILFHERPTKTNALWIGLAFGLSLATKISATLLISSIGAALLVDFILIFLKQPHRPKVWFPHLPKVVKKLIIEGGIIAIFCAATFATLEPFALIDFPLFWRQTLEQQAMTKNAFTFPYTLQYVGKTSYLYELKNIFFWGLGPLLATISFIGVLYTTYLSIVKNKSGGYAKELIILVYFWVYFLVVGSFAIGFMRYLLPLYPLYTLFAATIVYQLFSFFKHKVFGFPFYILHSTFYILLLIWPLSFMHIYTQPNTRVQATEWINSNLPPGTKIATEHWDDGLPIGTQSNYQVYELPMYETDENPIKWTKINQAINETEYIIISSNRLYTPLGKLTNCTALPPGRCYTQTANYYQKLFNEELGFKKVQEFAVYPKLEVGNWRLEIRDEEADESFTVYDHPKVSIFRKSSRMK